MRRALFNTSSGSAGRSVSRWLVSGVVALLTVAVGAVVALQAAPPALALENGVARTPPMGWNTWNTFGCNINETLIRQMADAIVSQRHAGSGLQVRGGRRLLVQPEP